ncbi:YfiR family protein [Pseudodesulfovibrio portus]|uniref:YfiR family protein n=1 Tax=Pseudodesulfovibrio portus TaxID=231439 RepID=A0ABM8AVL6_9BACT|nr:YfiR family protein [Pseudodesulfovibrio portus]BDQ35513.1 hypothetical protein JCM14722_30550 [Pseudodesulfovibrio portus]
MHPRWQVLFACLIWAFSLSTAVAGGGQGLTASPDRLRALYVQRLVKYVTWPEGAGPGKDEPFIVAAVDPDALRPYFAAGEAAARFRLVQWPARKYHVLVLIGAPQREVAAILKRVSGEPVLTISQNPVNLGLGSVVDFAWKNGKLKLEINSDAAEAAGLTVSSRLLQLARIYRKAER